MSRYLGTITTAADAAKGNDEATTFIIPTAAALVLEADADCYVKFHESSAEAKVTSTTGRRVTANKAFYCSAPTRNGPAAPVLIGGANGEPSARLTVLPTEGVVELKVFERRAGDM